MILQLLFKMLLKMVISILLHDKMFYKYSLNDFFKNTVEIMPAWVCMIMCTRKRS